MNEHHRIEFRAYLWTLAALVAVYFGTMIAVGLMPALVGKIETFGLGTVTGGLIGLLRIPRRPDATVTATAGGKGGAQAEMNGEEAV